MRLLLLMTWCAVVCFSAPPNVVLIVVDDLGYGDLLGPERSTDAKTPNIDRLLTASTVFTNAYVTAPICNASRIAITTGRQQQEFGTYWYASNGLPNTGAPTIAETLKTVGYVTGLVGKVHHGKRDRIGERDHPMKHGYDQFYGFFGGTKHYLQHNKHYNQGASPGPMIVDEKEVEIDGFSTELFGQQARAFVNANQKTSFFLHLSFNAVHNYCYQLPPAYLKAHGLQGMPDHNPKKEGLWDWRARVSYPNHKEGRDWYLGQLYFLDLEIGRLLDQLDALDLTENTAVFFISDNGGSLVTYANNGRYTGGKYTLFEGGLRVPLSVRYPSKFTPGKQVASLTSSLDLYPTICELANVTPPNKLAGRSLLLPIGTNLNRKVASGGSGERVPLRTPNILQDTVDLPQANRLRPANEGSKGDVSPLAVGDNFRRLSQDQSLLQPTPPARTLFWDTKMQTAVRRGKWKLLTTNKSPNSRLQITPTPKGIFLYDLEADPGEQKDLSAQHPELVADLSRLLKTWQQNGRR